MAEATATGRRGAELTSRRPDGQARTWATGTVALELIEHAHSQTGRRRRADLYQHALDVYLELVKWDARGARGRITFGQLQGQLYDDDFAAADPHAKRRSLRRWLNLLQDAGLIAWGPRTHPGSAKHAGLAYRLLAVPELHSQTARGYSSVGVATAPCGARRRRESRREREARRVAPWRRRGGRRGVPRWLPPDAPSPFFGPGKLPPLEPSPLRGEGRGGQTRVRVGAPPAWLAAVGAAVPWPGGWGGGRDAIQRACHPERRAALDALRTAAASGGGFGLLRRAALAGGPVDVIALAAWSLAFPALEPRLSIAKRDQLVRSAGQYDRLAGAGAAAVMLVERMAAADADAAQGLDPRTVAFYVADLKATARAERRRRRGAAAPRPHRPRGRA